MNQRQIIHALPKDTHWQPKHHFYFFLVLPTCSWIGCYGLGYPTIYLCLVTCMKTINIRST